ncbi:hypothetical protein [Streptomyces melanogenes]|uniref:hypothetical protein n=1 Tax=Streptomyces melanogenes TaxID=67326 RepID=UPI00167E84AA|nr:hypothetical protein [Streptomyces melanogenes]GGP86396.1 hypothetical protein GCM10010278_76050 [Streptomyces melanogenes]
MGGLNGPLGWNFYGGLFTITMDLGKKQDVARVDLLTPYDQPAGIRLARQPGGHGRPGQSRPRRGHRTADGEGRRLLGGVRQDLFDAQVTGVKADLAPTPGSHGWYMVSEITAR